MVRILGSWGAEPGSDTTGDGPQNFVKNIEGSAKYQVGLLEVPLLQKLRGCEEINWTGNGITSVAE